MIRAEDRSTLQASGKRPEEVERQLAVLAGPIPHVSLLRPCTLGDGLLRLPEATLPGLEADHEAAREGGRVSCFVPASGAATRMVAELVEAQVQGRALAPAWQALLAELPRLALWPAVAAAGARAGDVPATLQAMVGPGGLGLHRLPKALVPFHPGPEGARTAFEEHLVDAAVLAGREGRATLHLTIGPEHAGAFAGALAEVGPRVARLTGVQVEVRTSFQSPATDTVALGEDGEPVREANGRLLFRPGGHGALLQNLEATGGDVVLVRNIDNVVPDALRPEVHAWRRRLSGLLVRTQAQAWSHLAALRAGRGVAEAAAFVTATLGQPAQPEVAWLIDRLDRPWRVAGMVRNEGQPGGGPFHVAGQGSPQIVEQAQIALHDPQQAAILAASTHFNPVDLALGLRDAEGRPYTLARFADPGAAIVTTKSLGGRKARVLEHPGLWNGGMAGWNTVLVETPPHTFQPVKTLLDLARVPHGGWLP